MLHGIDVSENNGTIDWGKARAAGVRYAILKVNEGDYLDKRTTRARVDDAKRHGVIVGGYDFIRPRPGRTGAQEFDIFHKHARELGLLNHGCLRPVIDAETLNKYSNSAWGRYKVRRYIRSWIERCIQVTGKHPIIYTGDWFWDGTIKSKTGYHCALWLSAFVPAAKRNQFIPTGFDHIAFWQFTDKGRVDGVAGYVDQDLYLSDLAHLRRNHTL